GMLIEKLKIPVAILMMTALVGTGAGFTAYRVRAQESASTAPVETESKPRPLAKTERPHKHVTTPAEQPKDEKAKFRTENFVVTAPTKEIARRVGEAAEYNRKALSVLWLNKEPPAWAEPCPVRVTVSDKTTSSATVFQFQDGKVSRRDMFLESSLDRIFADLLLHEVTHAILAEWRGRPVPRWADEGAAMLSESAAGRARQERPMGKLMDTERLLPLRDLLPRLEYPKDVMAFYVQSFSLA